MPYGRAITEQSLKNALSMGRGVLGSASTDATAPRARAEFQNEIGMVFGARYASRAVIADGTAQPVVANPVSEYVASACPGGRAPHVLLELDGQPI